MKLTLVMIVKSESKDIGPCIESVHDLVDDMVIVDTGSGDGTVTIARDYGARVFDLEWVDDFSAARNHSLDQVKDGWVLVLDADERIDIKDHIKIRSAIESASLDVFILPQRHYQNDMSTPGWGPAPGEYPVMENGHPGHLETPAMRLFRSEQHIRFEGRVHENIVSTNLDKPLATKWLT